MAGTPPAPDDGPGGSTADRRGGAPPYPGAGGPVPGYPPPAPGGYWGAPPPGYPGAPPPGYPGAPPPGYPGYPGPGGPPGPPAVAPFADWGVRVGAYLIDSVLLWIVALLVDRALRPATLLVITLHTTNARGQHVVDHFSGMSLVVDAVVGLCYGTLLCGARTGQTLGMRLLRIRVVDERTGGPIGYWRALARVLLQWVALWMLFVPWAVDMLFPLWDARRQTLHDKIAGSVVVRT